MQGCHSHREPGAHLERAFALNYYYHIFISISPGGGFNPPWNRYMEDYSLGLALFDFLPVLVSACGLYLLADLLARALPESRALLLTGFALVIAGGLSKATWKLIWVLAQVNIAVLDALLFVCMAPGMILLALHTAAAGRRWRGGTVSVHPGRNGLMLIVPLLAAAAYLATSQPDGRAWFFVLLYASALANIVMSILLIRQSWAWDQRLTAAFFLASILLTLSLSGLARISTGSAPLQWLAEVLNLFATGCFALAVWRLRPFASAMQGHPVDPAAQDRPIEVRS